MNTTELLTQARDSLKRYVETDEPWLDEPGNAYYAEIYREGVRVLKELNDTLSKPASEDAWLVEADRLINELETFIRGQSDGMDRAGHHIYETKQQLSIHLRARPAPESFESVKEPTTRLAAELMEKEFVNLGNFSCTKEVWANKIRGWLFIRGPVEDALRKAMIEAAKESGK